MNTEKKATAQSTEEIFIDVSTEAKSVIDAIQSRHSIRNFLDRPVEPEKLQSILENALRAPSWKNAQPWKVHVVTGQARDRMSAALKEAALNGTPHPETPWLESYPANIKKRMFDLGMRVYGVAGIERKDKEARDRFMLRNFEFFDAPVALFITSTLETNFFVGIDIGCFLESLMLLCRHHGLGSCPQAALGAFPEVVKAQLSLPQDERVICGLSLGYPDNTDLNRFHSPRESLDSLVQFYS
ncbi:MAG: nitroreductase [Leptospiraceae bacterium]|nr:nitroreductase [Leptospiraceae bacterium]